MEDRAVAQWCHEARESGASVRARDHKCSIILIVFFERVDMRFDPSSCEWRRGGGRATDGFLDRNLEALI
jgi:hypothetical protein